MTSRIFAAGTLMAALAVANPLTIVITGAGSGSLGTTRFTSATFKFTLTTDTSQLVMPPCCPGDTDTPSGTPTTFTITGVGSGTLTDNQVVFVDPNGTAGLAHFNDGDMLDLDSAAFDGYAMATSKGPITGVPFIGQDPVFNNQRGGALLHLGQHHHVHFHGRRSAGRPHHHIGHRRVRHREKSDRGNAHHHHGHQFWDRHNNPPTIKINSETG